METKGTSPFLSVFFASLIFLDCIPDSSANSTIVLDGTTGNVGTQNLSGSGTITIDGNAGAGGQRHGTVVGPNLFFSFDQFGIDTSDSANFICSAGCTPSNVLSRVTGGSLSQIDGTLRSSISGANFWFINPAGVVFGPGATVDVPAGFHLSNATRIHGDNGRYFSADLNDTQSSLDIGTPERFGFLGRETNGVTISGTTINGPGPIEIVGSTLIINSGTTQFDTTLSVTVESDSGAVTVNNGAALTNIGTGTLSVNTATDLFNDGTINGNATAGTTLTNNGNITASATSAGALTNRAGATIGGLARTTGATADIVNDGNIGGGTDAGHNLFNHVTGTVSGTAVAANDVINEGTINGDATANESLTNGFGARIGGMAVTNGVTSNIDNNGTIGGGAQSGLDLNNRGTITGAVSAGQDVNNLAQGTIIGDVTAVRDVENQGKITQNGNADLNVKALTGGVHVRGGRIESQGNLFIEATVGNSVVLSNARIFALNDLLILTNTMSMDVASSLVSRLGGIEISAPDNRSGDIFTQSGTIFANRDILVSGFQFNPSNSSIVSTIGDVVISVTNADELNRGILGSGQVLIATKSSPAPREQLGLQNGIVFIGGGRGSTIEHFAQRQFVNVPIIQNRVVDVPDAPADPCGAGIGSTLGTRNTAAFFSGSESLSPFSVIQPIGNNIGDKQSGRSLQSPLVDSLLLIAAGQITCTTFSNTRG